MHTTWRVLGATACPHSRNQQHCQCECPQGDVRAAAALWGGPQRLAASLHGHQKLMGPGSEGPAQSAAAQAVGWVWGSGSLSPPGTSLRTTSIPEENHSPLSVCATGMLATWHELKKPPETIVPQRAGQTAWAAGQTQPGKDWISWGLRLRDHPEVNGTFGRNGRDAERGELKIPFVELVGRGVCTIKEIFS